MTLEKIEAALAAAEAARKATAEEIQRLTKEQKETEAAAQAAAEAGNLEEYMKLDADAKRKAAAVYVTKAKAAKTEAPPPMAEIAEAWKDYADKFGKAQQRRLDAYDKARRELFQMYNEILNEQNEAYRRREKACGWMGRGLNGAQDGDEASLKLFRLPDNTFIGLHYRSFAWTNPEMPFFNLTQDTDENYCNRVFTIVHRHRAV